MRIVSGLPYKKGMTGTNIAMVIFLWPDMMSAYFNGTEAIAAADAGQVHLLNLAARKRSGETALQADVLSTKAGKTGKTGKTGKGRKRLYRFESPARHWIDYKRPTRRKTQKNHQRHAV